GVDIEVAGLFSLNGNKIGAVAGCAVRQFRKQGALLKVGDNIRDGRSSSLPVKKITLPRIYFCKGSYGRTDGSFSDRLNKLIPADKPLMPALKIVGQQLKAIISIECGSNPDSFVSGFINDPSLIPACFHAKGVVDKDADRIYLP